VSASRELESFLAGVDDVNGEDSWADMGIVLTCVNDIRTMESTQPKFIFKQLTIEYHHLRKTEIGEGLDWE
jgi:hypothetical protein